MATKNPCKEIDRFEYFGHDTDNGCEICGNTPAKIEPRFGYTSCANHSWINPVRFQRIVSGEEKDPCL